MSWKNRGAAGGTVAAQDAATVGEAPHRAEQGAARRTAGVRLNGPEPQAWLRDVPEKLPSLPASRSDELLPYRRQAD